MENQTLIKALNRFADKDMSLARKTGAVCITDTKVGNVEVQYDDGVYTAYELTTGAVLSTGPAKVMRALIVSLYEVSHQ
jgi:hypothetical protein